MKLPRTEIKLITDTPILNQKSHYLPKTLHRPRELREVILQNHLPFDVTAFQSTVHSRKHDKNTFSVAFHTPLTKKQAGFTVKITWSSLTHTRVTGRSNRRFSRMFIAHDIQGAFYSCSGLTSHTVREELSASCRCTWPVAYATTALPKRSLHTTNIDFRPNAPRHHFAQNAKSRIWDATSTEYFRTVADTAYECDAYS